MPTVNKTASTVYFMDIQNKLHNLINTVIIWNSDMMCPVQLIAHLPPYIMMMVATQYNSFTTRGGVIRVDGGRISQDL